LPVGELAVRAARGTRSLNWKTGEALAAHRHC
jgi:hypothetical protein